VILVWGYKGHHYLYKGVPYFLRLPNFASTKIIRAIITTTNIIPDQTPALKIAPIASQLLSQNTKNKRRQLLNKSFFICYFL